MSSLFGKAKSAKPPAVQPVPAIPETTTEADEWAMRQVKKRKGFSKTLLVGGLSPVTDKKKFLG